MNDRLSKIKKIQRQRVKTDYSYALEVLTQCDNTIDGLIDDLDILESEEDEIALSVDKIIEDMPILDARHDEVLELIENETDQEQLAILEDEKTTLEAQGVKFKDDYNTYTTRHQEIVLEANDINTKLDQTVIIINDVIDIVKASRNYALPEIKALVDELESELDGLL
jgi:predicted  nucleic acid-binding Zn-ribbon protein